MKVERQHGISFLILTSRSEYNISFISLDMIDLICAYHILFHS